MSANNGIYLLQSLDGWRVIHAQAIENLYWFPICCENFNIVQDDKDDIFYHEKCLNCGSENIIWSQKDELNPQMLKNYFGSSDVFTTREEAYQNAEQLYNEIMCSDYCPICEYGISEIKGWENKPFPE